MKRRWWTAAATFSVATAVLSPISVSASTWTDGVSAVSHGESQATAAAETVNGMCTATAASTSCGSANLLPATGSSSTVAVADSGSPPVSYGLTALNCGAATLSDGNSAVTVAHSNFTPASYQTAGPLGGKALTFDGSTSWLSTGGTGSAGPQTFTQLAWFKTSSSTGGPILSMGNAINPTSVSATDRFLWVDNTGHLSAGVFDTPLSSQYRVATGTSTVDNGVWHLAAVTLSAAGLKLYVDGAVQATDAAATAAAVYTSAWWAIGAGDLNLWPDAPTATNGYLSYFNGSLAGVAVVPTALTAGQISALYSSVTWSAYATAVAGDSPTYYWGFQDTAPTGATASTATLPGQSVVDPDLSPNGNDATAVGGVTPSAVGPLAAGASSTFDGSTGALTTALSGTGPQTLTELAWINTTSTNGGVVVSFSGTSLPSGSVSSDRLLWVDPSGYLVAGVYPAGAVQTATGTSKVNNGSWHLVAMTVSAAGLSVYVDGVLQATNASGSGAQVFTGFWNVGDGRVYNWPDAPVSDSNSVSWFNGSMAGVAVVPVALSSSQIAALYASSGFGTYSGAVINDAPSDYWTLTGQSSACSAAVATVSMVLSGVTTCLLPLSPSGTACPAVATGGLPLIDLSTATVDTAVSASHSQSATLTIVTADNGSLPTALSGVDIVIDATVTGADGAWTAGAVYSESQTEL